MNFTATETYPNLLLYYDSRTQWPSVYPSQKSCLEKEKVLDKNLGQIISLNPYDSYEEASGCVFTTPFKNETSCSSHREFRSSRPRWWFIAISDCSSSNGINVTYNISLRNGEPGDFWREHFSADEFCKLFRFFNQILHTSLYAYIFKTFSCFACIDWNIMCIFNIDSRQFLHCI